MERITEKQVHAAFKRLHRAMGWPSGQPWNINESGKSVATVGVVYLGCPGFGYQIEVIGNEGGGVHTPFPGWTSKRQAFETMAAMASAVEMFKRENVWAESAKAS